MTATVDRRRRVLWRDDPGYVVTYMPVSAPLTITVTAGDHFAVARLNGEPWLRVSGPEPGYVRDTLAAHFDRELPGVVARALGEAHRA